MVCNKEYVLDLDKETLTRGALPFSVEPGYYRKVVQIKCGDVELFSDRGYCSETRFSDSGESFGWLMRYNDISPGHVLYAKFKGREDAVKIGEGNHHPTRIVAWIE